MDFLVDSLVLHDPTVQLILDSLFKSAVILGITALILLSIRERISSTAAHLVWLGSLVCVAILPLISTLSISSSALFPNAQPIHVIGVSLWAMDLVSVEELMPTRIVLGIYWSVVALLALRVLIAGYLLFRLHRQTVDLDDAEVKEQFNRIKTRLDIEREVQLRTSPAIASPFSYGLFRPVVVLPDQACQWQARVREEVLQHELSHIKRLDWLTLLMSQLLCCFLWMNPLVWFASKKLHDESEQACDSANLDSEQSRIRYAEDLLQLARQQKDTSNYSLLVQPMYDGGELTMRIKNILEGKKVSRLSRGLKFSLLLSVVMISLATTGVKLIAADTRSDGDYLPLRAVAPQYPTRAATEEIEGWILVSFTVRADGLVDPFSIEIVDEEPAGYFENAARRATEQFEFQPRVVDGLAVDVPGVQYLFRFHLQDEGVPNFDRPPPEANRD